MDILPEKRLEGNWYIGYVITFLLPPGRLFTFLFASNFMVYLLNRAYGLAVAATRLKKQGGRIVRYKLFPFVMVAFVVVFLLSNTVAVKVTQLGPFYFDGATILFPLAYIFGDIMTEVYGFKKSRLVIWSGFAACAFMGFVYWLIGVLPAAPDWRNQEAYNAILGQTPRIVLASLVAYFCGEFVNSFIMAKMKILTSGRRLWTRTIGSTVVGQAVDTSLFVAIAFTGVIPGAALLHMAVSNYVFKTCFEAAATPVTYAACGWLKRVEQEDYFDHETNFNPFAVSMDDLK